MLKDDLGANITGSTAITVHVLAFCTKLSGTSSPTQSINLVLISMGVVLTLEMREMLIRQVTSNEVKVVVFDTEVSKAEDRDGNGGGWEQTHHPPAPSPLPTMSLSPTHLHSWV